jgi:hypothetical protein
MTPEEFLAAKQGDVMACKCLFKAKAIYAYILVTRSDDESITLLWRRKQKLSNTIHESITYFKNNLPGGLPGGLPNMYYVAYKEQSL